MPRLRLLAPLLVVFGLLLTACQPSSTQLAATPAVATQAAQPTPTAPLAATSAPTQVQAATVAASPTAAATATVAASPTTAATAVQSTATPAPTQVQAATADAGVLATKINLDTPWGIAFDASGNLYVSTCLIDPPDVRSQIVAIDPAGLLKHYAGTNSYGWSGDGGPARLAGFTCTAGLAFDLAGNLYVADQGNNRIRRIDKNGTISTVAGSGAGIDTSKPYCCLGSFSGDGGPATAATLWNPTDIAFDRQGNLYIADHNNDRVRKVDQQGVITTVAGSGTEGFSGDGGPATAAQLNTATPYVITPEVAKGPASAMSIALDAAGNLYIADSGNARVRKVNTKGIIITIAGTGKPGFAGDGGRAKAAQLSSPSGLAFDADGSLYIADGPSLEFQGNHIRKIDKAGIITTVAGTGETGFSGDGGPATAAALSAPASITFDAQGNLYFADGGNNRVRKIDMSGIITTVVGGGF
jgi:trimeric autotransporter adhesin